jgi:hypothetical protein
VLVKRLELLHQLVPTAKVIALLVNPTNPRQTELETKEAQVAARTLGLQLHVLNAGNESEFETAFETLRQRGAGALLVQGETSANPGGEPGWIRKRFTADFLTAFHEHFRHEGKRVIAKVAKQQPAAYLRCLTMLVPKEMKVEQTGGIKAMTDEQLDAAIGALQDLLNRRALAAQGKLIEGSVTPALPEPEPVDEKPA